MYAYTKHSIHIYTIVYIAPTHVTNLVGLCEEYVVKIPGSRLDAALGLLGGGHRQARTLREVFQQHHVVKGQAGDIPMVSSIVWYIV